MVSGHSVHPRAYGEHKEIPEQDAVYTGSSPCIRGTQIYIRSIEFCFRFIPVHTGNTGFSLRTITVIAVHPRAYGEHKLCSVICFTCIGSSPCIRGTHDHIDIKTSPLRFIPVHTGNTSGQLPTAIKLPVHPRAYGEHSNHNRLNL